MSQRSHRFSGTALAIPFAFGCVYLFWGSTYTAIKIGVQYLPPLVLASTRYMISGVLMLLLCRLRGLGLGITRREMFYLAVIGILLLTGGNILLIWGELYIASGLAALLVAVVPLYVALLGMVVPGGERLRARGWFGVILGLAGLGVLLSPSLRHGFGSQGKTAMGAVIVLLSALCWSVGSLVSRHTRLPVNPFVASGWQMLFAGLVNVALATAFRAWPQAHWTHAAWGSIAYLVTFGSLVGYTAYIWLIEHVPVPKLATYAYVNPIVAVILGAIVLGERLGPTEYIGMVAVLAAVALLTSSKLKSGKPAAELDCNALESEA
jgi:drug/metabolite transporter (DMT)-like permease